jgi:hypothetical protein
VQRQQLILGKLASSVVVELANGNRAFPDADSDLLCHSPRALIILFRYPLLAKQGTRSGLMSELQSKPGFQGMTVLPSKKIKAASS